MSLFILIKIFACFLTNSPFHEQHLNLLHDLGELGEGDYQHLARLLQRLGQLLVSQLLDIEGKGQFRILVLNTPIHTHLLEHNVLKVEVPDFRPLRARALVLSLRLLLKARGNHQQVVELERLLVIAVLLVTRFVEWHLQRPVDVLLQRIVQGRDHFGREVAHALVEQQARLF